MISDRIEKAKAAHFDDLLRSLEHMIAEATECARDHSRYATHINLCDGCINAQLVLSLALLTRKAEEKEREARQQG